MRSATDHSLGRSVHARRRSRTSSSGIRDAIYALLKPHRLRLDPLQVVR